MTLVAATLVPLGFDAQPAAEASSHVGDEGALVADDTQQTRTLDVEYHASTGQYVAVWAEHADHTSPDDGETHTGDDEIRAGIVGLDGTLDSDFAVSEGGGSKDFPQVAHMRHRKREDESVDRPSLVVWADNGDIQSQVIRASGSGKQGNNVEVFSDDDNSSPAVAHGRGAGVFLVVWERETSDGESDVWGRLVTATSGSRGQPNGEAFRISDQTPGRTAAPSVAFDRYNDQFLVTWGDDRGSDTEERDIYGQLVDADGNLVDGNFEIYADNELQRAPETVFHPERTRDEYLVVWSSAPGFRGNAEVRAQRVADDGALRGDDFTVDTDMGHAEAGEPTVNHDTGHYIVPATGGGNAALRTQVMAVELDRDGDRVERLEVPGNSTDGKGPAAAAYGATSDPAGPAEVASDVLVVWRDSRSGEDLTDQNLWARTIDRHQDLDGDGIPDRVELGEVGPDLASMGANPCRETIAIEVDYMEADDHTHEPKDTAIDEIVEAFDNAPRPAVEDCPYPEFEDSEDGIDFLVDVDDAIDHEDVVGLGDRFEEIRAENFTPQRRPYFHYNLWVHDRAEDSSSSGVCCNDRDFVVSLGSWRSQTGSAREQSGTMMHELGHAFGFGHGGQDGRNRKPNYLSIMSYSWQTKGIYDASIEEFRIDYSDRQLSTLDETALDEETGVGVDDPVLIKWLDADFNRQTDRGDEPVDWDGDGDIDEDDVAVDINNDGVCVKPGDDGDLDSEPEDDDVVDGKRIRTGPDRSCDTEAHDDDKQRRSTGYDQPDELDGSDDWSAITFRGTMSARGTQMVDEVTPVEEELTYEESQAINESTESALSPDLVVDKTVERIEAPGGDKVDTAIPGDTIVYTVEVANEGEGRATDVELADTFPDGSEETRALDDLEPGDTAEATFEYPVPEDTTDGTELTNTATAEASDLLGRRVEDMEDASDEADVVVHTPVLELDKDAPASAAAGEELEYGLTLDNVGGAEAQEVTLTDTLPEGVYFSEALNDGEDPDEQDARELTFARADLTAGGQDDLSFTVTPSLLLLDGEALTNEATVEFTDRNDNDYKAVDATATTTIDAPAPSEDPEGLGFWRNHDERWTEDSLRAIQATDTRYDVDAADGELTEDEVEEALSPGGGMPAILRRQLLTLYFNLAEQRVVAGTEITSELADEHDLDTVADAAEFAIDTLAEELQRGRGGNSDRYADATDLLEEINENRSPGY